MSGSSPHLIQAFILDFDGTITTKDTISTLAKFGLSKQAGKGIDLSKVWEEVVKKYGQDYQNHNKKYKPLKEDRDTATREFDYYRSLKDVETISFGRVSESGVFRGISTFDWETFGSEAIEKGEVVVRAGFKEFLERIKKQKDLVGVVSVNFSRHFIRGVLQASAGPQLSQIEVVSNHPDENGVLLGPRSQDGGFGPIMVTSDAKLASMRGLLHSFRGGGGKGREFSRVIYIGDSGTDIECLTEDNVIGIIISEDGESLLVQIMKRLGVELLHIGQCQASQGGFACWARDFGEIVESPVFDF
jgi:2-hydroxy-3-keto-5-methylthiopentenyl-1-phosphate phosphatase